MDDEVMALRGLYRIRDDVGDVGVESLEWDGYGWDAEIRYWPEHPLIDGRRAGEEREIQGSLEALGWTVGNAYVPVDNVAAVAWECTYRPHPDVSRSTMTIVELLDGRMSCPYGHTNVRAMGSDGMWCIACDHSYQWR